MSLPEITLDELARLVRLLGMLGSASDGEVLSAARFAVRWVREHGTDWETLLTPEPEPAVSAVVALHDPDPDTADLAYQQGHRAGYEAGVAAGLAKAMAQVKAQANLAAGRQAAHAGQPGWQSFNPWSHAAAQAATGHSPFTQPVGQGPAPQGPVRAPSTSPGAVPAGGWPPGSWQAVAQELLDQHAAVPGVLRSREEIFVADILRRGFPTLTQAQEHWLRDIAGRNHMSW